MRKLTVLISLAALVAGSPASAALEPLLFSGQPGITVDVNGNGQVDPGEGMISARFDPDVDVIIFDLDASLGGGSVIFQITERFNSQVLQEVAQYPLDGPPQIINLRPAAEFFTIFLDTVDLTPEIERTLLLDTLQGDQ